MSKKYFSWLLLLTLAVGAAILLVPVKTGHQSGIEEKPLIPGMASWVNDVKWVRIVKAGNQTVATLVRAKQGWVIKEAESYPADWAKVKALLAGLAQAEVVEPKTTNPAYFNRLGLKDVTDSSSKAMMVEIGHGKHTVSVLIGHGAKDREGQYVRLLSKKQALLIDKKLDVAANTSDWLKRDIVDLSEAEVVEATITHPDGEKVTVRKASADDQDFKLQGIPKGREVQSSWSVNALGGMLSGLLLDQVTAEKNIDWSKATHLRVLTADGIEVNADLAQVKDKSWIRLAASVYTPKLVSAAKEKGEKEKVEAKGQAESKGKEKEQAGTKASEEKTKEEKAAADRAKRVDGINRRVKGWAYAIPQYKADVMTKRLEDLLKPKPKPKKKK